MGKLTDIDLMSTIGNFKGHQLETALEVEYDIRGTADERNLLFDLPVVLLALGCHRRVHICLTPPPPSLLRAYSYLVFLFTSCV